MAKCRFSSNGESNASDKAKRMQLPPKKSRHSRKCALLALALLAMAKVCSGQIPTSPKLHWYRGNTHSHTSAPEGSDANETPDVVARWYQEHGYQFLVITDHELLTDVDPLNALYGKNGKFLVVRGQEVTQMVADPEHVGGVRHGHVNGIDTDRVVMPIRSGGGATLAGSAARGITLADAYKRNVAAIHAGGGMAQVNHPNLAWSVKLDDLLPIPEPFLLEIWNGYPSSNNLGGVDEAGNVALSAEALWDALISKGRMVWGVAGDDSHTYHQFDNSEAPNPGKAWVVACAEELTVDSIVNALRSGHFYASTGIVLDSYAVDAKEIVIKIRRLSDWSPGLSPVTRYMTRFIGREGRVLAEAPGLSPHYVFRGDEQYVRTSIIDSDGRRAWTQPVFFDDRKAAEDPVDDPHPGYCGDSR